MCAAVRRVRTRYNESVPSGHRDGSVGRAVCESKEVSRGASRYPAAFSVDGLLVVIVAVPLLRTGLERRARIDQDPEKRPRS